MRKTRTVATLAAAGLALSGSVILGGTADAATVHPHGYYYKCKDIGNGTICMQLYTHLSNGTNAADVSYQKRTGAAVTIRNCYFGDTGENGCGDVNTVKAGETQAEFLQPAYFSFCVTGAILTEPSGTEIPGPQICT